MDENRLTYSIAAEHFDDAEDVFVDAKNRLLDVNNWHKPASNMGAVFALVDTAGKELHRKAHKGDCIQIAMPNSASQKLHVDALIYDDFPDENIESFTMQLSADSTSILSLMIERHGLKLTTSAIGKPHNIQWDNLLKGLLE